MMGKKGRWASCLMARAAFLSLMPFSAGLILAKCSAIWLSLLADVIIIAPAMRLPISPLPVERRDWKSLEACGYSDSIFKERWMHSFVLNHCILAFGSFEPVQV